MPSVVIIMLFLVVVPAIVIPITVSASIKKQREQFNAFINEYASSAYYRVTRMPYNYLLSDRGKMGEYLLYKSLQRYEEYGAKFLFNLYIPTENGGITELDILMICRQGIIAFENKNYRGWIFGDENQQYWYQTFKTGRKEKFYNPIKQNSSHIKHLKKLINKNIPILSYVVFSDECQFKGVSVSYKDAGLVHMSDVDYAVYYSLSSIAMDVMTYEEVIGLYEQLYPYTQVGYDIKNEHANSINSKYIKNQTYSLEQK